MSIETITVADGKYTVTHDRGVMKALRNGEPWGRDISGDNLIYWMFVRIRQLEELTSHMAPPAQGPADDAPSEAERLLQGIGDAAHRVGIYNGTAPLSGPLALMLLNDMVEQMGVPPRELKNSADDEARALAGDLAAAAQQDDNDPEGHDISGGLLGPHVSAWLRKLAAERLQATIHPESGMTAEQLWLETGHLRARLADMKADAKAAAKPGPANNPAASSAPGNPGERAQHQGAPVPAAPKSFMRPVVSRASSPAQQPMPAADQNTARAEAPAAQKAGPAPARSMRMLKP